MLNHAVKFAFGLWAFIFSVHIVHIQKGLVGYHLMHKKKKVRAQKKGQHWTLSVHAQDVTIKQTFVT